MIPSEWLHAFAVFAEDANMSRAARRLHLSQPAVHAQLKKLEAEIGVPLYRRVGRGLALTKEGSVVAAFARDEAERVDALLRELRGETGERCVVLAAGGGAIVHVLGGGVHAFTRKGAARVEVVTADAKHALDLVRRGLAHVGVAALDAPPADLDVHELVETPQVVVAPRDHRLAKKRSATLADLEGERIVAPPEGGPQRAALDAALAAHHVKVAVSATARGWDVVLRLVELRVGLGIVNGTCTIPRALVARPLRELPRVTYYAFTRPRPRADVVELVRAFIASR